MPQGRRAVLSRIAHVLWPRRSLPRRKGRLPTHQAHRTARCLAEQRTLPVAARRTASDQNPPRPMPHRPARLRTHPALNALPCITGRRRMSVRAFRNVRVSRLRWPARRRPGRLRTHQALSAMPCIMGHRRFSVRACRNERALRSRRPAQHRPGRLRTHQALSATMSCVMGPTTTSVIASRTAGNLAGPRHPPDRVRGHTAGRPAICDVAQLARGRG
jgi:hypothetical protein